MRHLGRREFRRGLGKDIGEIQLALAIVGAQVREPVAQCGGIGGEDAAVDGADETLRVIGIAMLDNGTDAAFGIAHDAAVAGGVIEVCHQHGQSGVEAEQMAQGGRADQRHVAVQHQHARAIGDGRHGLLHGVAGAALLALLGPLQIALLCERGLHLLAGVTVHDVDNGGFERPRSGHHVRQHRLAGNGLQHLGTHRLHALAFTGSKDDDVQRCGGWRRSHAGPAWGSIKRIIRNRGGWWGLVWKTCEMCGCCEEGHGFQGSALAAKNLDQLRHGRA